MRNWNHVLERKMALPRAARKWLKYEDKLGDRMIKQLLNSVIAKYHDLSVSRRSIICLSLRLRQIIDLLAADKSRYFAQPRPLIVNYFMADYLLNVITAPRQTSPVVEPNLFSFLVALYYIGYCWKSVCWITCTVKASTVNFRSIPSVNTSYQLRNRHLD